MLCNGEAVFSPRGGAEVFLPLCLAAGWSCPIGEYVIARGWVKLHWYVLLGGELKREHNSLPFTVPTRPTRTHHVEVLCFRLFSAFPDGFEASGAFLLQRPLSEAGRATMAATVLLITLVALLSPILFAADGKKIPMYLPIFVC